MIRVPTGPFIALAHVASQLTGIYLSLDTCNEESLSGEDMFAPKPLECWSLREWTDYAADFFLKDPKHPKFLKVRRRLQDQGLSLASETLKFFQDTYENNGKILLITDSIYPKLLAHIPDPPLLLSGLGNLSLLRTPSISVIGSRRATVETLRECYELGIRLSQFSINAVSGGAYGCDIATHLGVLSASDGTCLATTVFAGGLAHLYPKGNLHAFREIIQHGGLCISERLWAQAARPADFPIRNRIISGLSYELLVMQAAPKSGSLITARKALDQGREVLVLRPPSMDFDAGSGGSKELIVDGAYSFGSVDELLSQYTFFHEACSAGRFL
ncbi:MAG: DNA-processing protein DprA [Oligoflexales bacterium]